MNSVVYVSGTPYEQGLQTGHALKDVIGRNLDRIRRKMDQDGLTGNARYDAFVGKNLAFLEKEDNEIYEEIRGIADGSGYPFRDIVYLNIPAYFMSDYFNQECSMILARGRATQDGKTYVIKNRDMKTFIEQAVFQRTYPDGMKIIEINGAGTVTYPACGMNSFGLGVTNTGFWSAKAPSAVERAGCGHVFLNAHDLLRSCRSAAEALETLKKTSRLNGLNVILADTENAYLVEMTKDDCHVTEDDGSGILYHTNHYTSENYTRMNPEREQYPSTFARYERIGELLKKEYGKIRFQDLFRIMSDHANGVNAICRHLQPGAPAQTVSTSMFVLEDGEAWSVLGNPCEELPHVSLD